jgi:hypothetical protein
LQALAQRQGRQQRLIILLLLVVVLAHSTLVLAVLAVCVAQLRLLVAVAV